MTWENFQGIASTEINACDLLQVLFLFNLKVKLLTHYAV